MAFSLVSSTPIMGSDKRSPVIDAHQKMGDDDILDVGRIELGKELFAQAFYRRLYIAWCKRLLAILSNQELSTY